MDEHVIRNMLNNWASWQEAIETSMPPPTPAAQPMFREMMHGYTLEDARQVHNRFASRYDEAVYSEEVLCRLSIKDQSVITRYFIEHRNTVVCAMRLHMSRRQFERWLNDAIHRFSEEIADDPTGQMFAREVASQLRR